MLLGIYFESLRALHKYYDWKYIYLLFTHFLHVKLRTHFVVGIDTAGCALEFTSIKINCYYTSISPAPTCVDYDAIIEVEVSIDTDAIALAMVTVKQQLIGQVLAQCQGKCVSGY